MTICLAQAADLLVDGDWVESKDQDSNGDVRLIQLADIGVGKFLDRSSRFLTSEKARQLRCTFLEPGDILIARMPDPIGRACIFPDLERPCVTAVDVSILRVSKNVDREYPVNWINSPEFLYGVQSHAKGATRKRISRKNLERMPVDLPALTEQRRIVARIKECMERVEEIEELTKEQSRAESQVLRAARREFLGNPLEIPPGWEEKRLDELADVIYGISAAISKNKDPKIGPPIVRMANISIDGHLDLSDLRYCPIPKGKEDHFALKSGDLLLNWRSGSAEHVGKTALFNGVGLYTCASFILRIRSLDGVSNSRFLRHVLNFMRAEGVFSGQSRMQINHKLNATEFSAFPIRVPRSIQEQEIIADKLDAIEAFSNQIRNEISQKLDEVRDLRESILRKAFTGEL